MVVQAPAKDQGTRTEDSARTAYEELMQEENQAAAKAAAKKTKKQKQKAKKQQAAAATAAEQAAPSESEDEHDQFSLQQPMQTASFGLLDQFPRSSLGQQSDPSVSPEPSPGHGDNVHALRDLHGGSGKPSASQAITSIGTGEANNVELAPDRYSGSPSSAEMPAQAMATMQASEKMNNGRQHDEAPAAATQDSDAQFLQALFCCPITKVSQTADKWIVWNQYLPSFTLALSPLLGSPLLFFRCNVQQD